jgi:hypothetical protein
MSYQLSAVSYQPATFRSRLHAGGGLVAERL